MGMTITEKILAKHAGLTHIEPGQLVQARIDLALGNDVTAPLAIKAFRESGISKVFDPDRIVLVPDHFTPNKDINSAHLSQIIREFAREQALKHYYEVGRMGIEHALLPEAGLVLPGDLVIGADSHTCTYGALGAFSTGVGSTDLAAAMITGELWFKVPSSVKFVYSGRPGRWVCGKDLILFTIGQIGVDGALYDSMEFTGEMVDNLPMDDRFTMSNMAIEAGAKSGIFAADDNTLEYIKGRSEREYEILASDPDSQYRKVYSFKVDNIEPQVALPHLPSKSKSVRDCSDIPIDQAVIGSCTNGRITDLRVAAKILKGKKVHANVRLIVIPATQKIYLQALKEGLLEIFVEAEAVVSTPTCGPCLGGHMGVLAEGERAISTTNRNFVGRMGHPKSEVYLSSPAVAAASAILGRIAHPEDVLG